MSVTLDLSGRVALVTGGARGVGRGITARFLDAGATVVICGRNQPESLPDGVSFVTADVREPEQVNALVEQIVGDKGSLDIVINNAGGAPPADAATASARYTERVVSLNMLSAIWVSQAANNVMQQQDGGGSIINITSVSAMRPSPEAAVYGAAKAGLINLVTSLAFEWGPKVRVNCVTAGLIATEQADLYYGGDEGIKRVSAIMPMGRMGTPKDIGDACLFLASPLAEWITGTNLVVHGGGERPSYIDAAKG
jgi:NAD(P)-dependent dehydrogenase (short-subunit alcohol dehydrogenase family)